MVKNKENDVTPARPPSLKKQNSSVGSSKNQASILGFFSKKPAATPTPKPSADLPAGVLQPNSSANSTKSTPKPNSTVKKPQFKTPIQKRAAPVPSSDNIEPDSSQENENGGIPTEVDGTTSSPPAPAKSIAEQIVDINGLVLASSPSRKVHSFLLHFLVSLS
ncbi:hypothetical protein EYC84_006275 [Monilinia fructicola]|uniref:Uncharacterized protein n=1 Tax=Monilinia fructicola TaxID=38448 RepID=A0A5M9K6B3_MONFR|nr:hypothetical protein EYC84_006275 [Monilinia fructicola]